MDDFAIRKNHTYGTVMIDAVSHQTIDMLPSRETSEVSEWLKKYPGLRIVSRDGSVSYAAAITGADAQIIQVSDRFHLVKGLSDVCKKEIQTLLHANFVIPSPGSHYEGKKEEAGYWEKKAEPDVVERTHEKNRERKQKLVGQVRELSANGMSKAQISREVGLSYSTVKRYLNPDFSASNAGYDQKHASKIKPYEETIRTLLKAGRTFKEIETAIKEQGYDGASSTIRMYATRERKLLRHAEKTGGEKGEVIERKWLIKLLYRPIEKISGITEEQLGRVIEKYPLIGKLYDQMSTFKETLFGRDASELDKWIKEARTLEIEGLDSFVNGLERDIEAVKNAIRLKNNNGLAEGTVNKVKVAKRIMYGRCSFATLKKKILLREVRRKQQQT